MDARRDRRRPRHPLLRLGLQRPLLRGRRRRLRRRVRRRPHPEPVPALQRARIKFAALLDKAVALGFDAVCTGHYALVTTDGNGRRELHRASEEAKDQSYVLGVLTADQIAHAMFPLGRTPSKAARARRGGSAAASRVAQQARQPRHLLHPRRRHPRLARRPPRQRARARSSTRDGAEVGRHEGAHAYTVGQREGSRHHAPRGRRPPAIRARGEARVEHRRRRAARGPRDRRARRRAVVLVRARRPQRRGHRLPLRRAGARARRPGAGRRASLDRARASSRVAPDEPILGLAPGQSAGALRRHPRARPGAPSTAPCAVPVPA